MAEQVGNNMVDYQRFPTSCRCILARLAPLIYALFSTFKVYSDFDWDFAENTDPAREVQFKNVKLTKMHLPKSMKTPFGGSCGLEDGLIRVKMDKPWTSRVIQVRE